MTRHTSSVPEFPCYSEPITSFKWLSALQKFVDGMDARLPEERDKSLHDLCGRKSVRYCIVRAIHRDADACCDVEKPVSGEHLRERGMGLQASSQPFIDGEGVDGRVPELPAV